MSDCDGFDPAQAEADHFYQAQEVAEARAAGRAEMAAEVRATVDTLRIVANDSPIDEYAKLRVDGWCDDLLAKLPKAPE